MFYAYQGLENTTNQVNEQDLSNADTLKRFKEFICHAQPGDSRYTYQYRWRRNDARISCLSG